MNALKLILRVAAGSVIVQFRFTGALALCQHITKPKHANESIIRQCQYTGKIFLCLLSMPFFLRGPKFLLRLDAVRKAVLH
jgi:hypothetical protein